MADWYARPVFPVAAVPDAPDFYCSCLGFTEDWRFEEGKEILAAQVSREGCEILLRRLPGQAGTGLLFLSLEPGQLDQLREDYEDSDVEVEDGWWGYRLMEVRDPDGNRLQFAYPAE
jgi:catechol 2,3-dioxygenase-like lactoylglutathione lyase family enzyme